MPEEQSFCDVGKSSKKVWKERVIHALMKSQKYGLPGTNGTWTSNLLAYLSNCHQLLAIFFAHRLHPFTKRERAVVIFCSFAFAFLATAIATREVADNSLICERGCEPKDLYWNGWCGDNSCKNAKEYNIGYSSESCGEHICGNNLKDLKSEEDIDCQVRLIV